MAVLAVDNKMCERMLGEKAQMDESFKNIEEAEEASDLLQDVCIYLSKTVKRNCRSALRLVGNSLHRTWRG